MSAFIKKIESIFAYKEPNYKEAGFELLEDAKEGIRNEDKEKVSSEPDKKSENVPKGKKKFVKKPLTAREWNESRRDERPDERPCQAEDNTDIISEQLCVSLETVRQKFLMPRNRDAMIREFRIGRKVNAAMVYIEGMVDRQTLNISILPQLMSRDVFEAAGEQDSVEYLIKNILTIYNVQKTAKYSEAIMQVLIGESALFIEGCGECILLETRGYEKRNVEPPKTENVVKGSQEGFTENLRTNLTLIRRIIKNEKLITEMMPIGSTNHSNCAIVYMEGIANPKVVQELKRRLKKIDTDFVLGDGMIEQFIEDNSFMLFPQVLSTERPDRTASFIMEGQVVVIAEGTPFALTVPVTFFRLFHTSEDTNVRWPLGTFLRLIRLFGLFCATLLPGFYVALTLFHPEMLPTELLTSISMTRETVPFPTIIEVLIMEVSFELIRESGIRVPSVIGQTLGIVGALILGEAAVAAGLVSPFVVIIVSVTGLGSFAIPNYTLALSIRIERFIFIFVGAFLGFYGIALMIALLAFTACSMKSFGVPFFAPIAPKTKKSPDVILRYPIWAQKVRPDGLNTPNRKKQGYNVKVWIHEKNRDRKDKRDNE